MGTSMGSSPQYFRPGISSSQSGFVSKLCSPKRTLILKIFLNSKCINCFEQTYNFHVLGIFPTQWAAVITYLWLINEPPHWKPLPVAKNIFLAYNNADYCYVIKVLRLSYSSKAIQGNSPKVVRVPPTILLSKFIPHSSISGRSKSLEVGSKFP